MAWPGKPDPVLALAALMGVKPRTVRQWVLRGKVVRLPDGGFDPDSLERWLTERNTRMIRRGLQPVA